MTDHLDRAAKVIAAQMHGRRTPSMCLGIARALKDAAAHEAEVAAKALREAAEEVYGDDRAAGPYSHPLSAASWLRERADLIEREAGESDADA